MRPQNGPARSAASALSWLILTNYSGPGTSSIARAHVVQEYQWWSKRRKT
ncbi:hypothetical protein [Ktedonospora formicarum]|nr:hypothetical protein [Ktedonospora formicarum]